MRFSKCNPYSSLKPAFINYKNLTMKKITLLPVLAMLISFSLFTSSCKKDTATKNTTMYNIAATLSGAQEVPAVTTNGTGTVTGTYDASTNTLAYNVSWSNLSGNATLAHFHGPAAAGTNAGVVIPFTLTAGATSVSGTTTLTDAQETDFLNGLWYANVHTAAHGSGEIRGQVTATLQ
jgi:hypothetical protein